MTPVSHHPDASWPRLPALSDWQDTLTTVHMWSQIVGKIRLRLAPAINHWWGAALYTTTRGLSTSPIPHGRRTFSIELDFLDHLLRISASDGTGRSFALGPMSVAEFFSRTMSALAALGIE